MKRALPFLRYLAAALLLVVGLVHLKLYLADGYKDFPDENVGRSFLLDTVASVILAVAVAVRREWWIRVAGIVVACGTLIAFGISRTDRGIFGLKETGFEPSPEALINFVAAVGAIVLLVVLLLVDRAPARGEATSARTAMIIGGGAVVLTAVLAIMWNADADSAEAVAGGNESSGSSVAIADFAFSPAEFSVPAGTTVTWTNNDGTPHSVVAEDGSFSSETLQGGSSYSTTFDQAGTFAYLCGIHSSMRGTVVVTGS